MIQDYKNGEPNAWSGFLRDDLLLMQFKNEEWQYSFQNLGFWKKKLESIAEKMNNLSDNRLWQPAEAVLEDWKRVIQQYQAEKAKRYLARETMKPYEQKLFALEKGETPEEKISIQTIPYKAPAISPEGKGRERKLGFTKHSKKNSGFSGYDGIGNKFGTVIKGSGKASQLKAFNFHIRHTTFQQVKYQLHLFAMNDDKPAHAIIPEPIPGSFENTKEGWIILDLSKYNVISEGENILAVIEIVETVKKDKEGCLFLSQANPITDFFNAQPELSGYDIWAATFSFYFLTN